MKESKVISIDSTTNWEAIIKEAQNFAQSETFWDSLLPKSKGEDKPLAVIRV